MADDAGTGPHHCVRSTTSVLRSSVTPWDPWCWCYSTSSYHQHIRHQRIRTAARALLYCVPHRLCQVLIIKTIITSGAQIFPELTYLYSKQYTYSFCNFSFLSTVLYSNKIDGGLMDPQDLHTHTRAHHAVALGHGLAACECGRQASCYFWSERDDNLAT